MAKTKKQIATRDFDKRAEEGEDLSEFFDSESGTKRFNLDMPMWALRELDAEADRMGITRQSLVKTWLIERLDSIRAARADQRSKAASA